MSAGWATMGRGALKLVALVGALALLSLTAIGPLVGAAPPGARPSAPPATAIVQPRPTIPLKFSHKLHATAMKCVECHRAAPQSTRSSDLLVPGHAVCRQCHEQADTVPTGLLSAKQRQGCSMCHTKVGPKGEVPRVSWPAPRFRFSHRKHLTGKTRCVSCHQGIAGATQVGALHLPRMATCLSCHKDRRAGQPSRSCAKCHEAKRGGQMRTTFPEGTLKPGPSLAALEHTPSFRTQHAAAGRAQRQDCEECHQDKTTCFSCHGSWKPRPHQHRIGPRPSPARPSPTRATVVVSPLVQPSPRIPLRFDHARHAQLACTSCHRKAATSPRAADVLLPGHDACVKCHQQAKRYAGRSPMPAALRRGCEKCHAKVDDRGAVARVVWPAPRMRFSHRVHAERQIGCAKCHAGVASSRREGSLAAARSLHLPAMSACLSCHQGGSQGPRRCVSCHERAPGGKVRTTFPQGKLIPAHSLPTLDHGLLRWKGKGHVMAARRGESTCLECHQRSTCVSCHGGVRKPARIHLGNYIMLHGREARANRQKCASCHTRQRFCLACHQRLNLNKQVKSPFALGRRRFHGPNWASTTTTSRQRNRHAVHARRNAGACAACHRESDCTSCHSRRRIGGLGHNPHGPGFRFSRRCRQLLRKNRRSCIKCHGADDALPLLCR